MRIERNRVRVVGLVAAMLIGAACGTGEGNDSAVPDTVVPYTRPADPPEGRIDERAPGPDADESDGPTTAPEPSADADDPAFDPAEAEEGVRALVAALLAANQSCDVSALRPLYAEQLAITFSVAGTGSTTYSDRGELLADLEVGCDAVENYRYETIGTPEVVVDPGGDSAAISYAARELSTYEGMPFDFEVSWEAVAERSETGWVVVSGRGVGTPIQA
jgi:hypothetical protein